MECPTFSPGKISSKPHRAWILELLKPFQAPPLKENLRHIPPWRLRLWVAEIGGLGWSVSVNFTVNLQVIRSAKGTKGKIVLDSLGL